MNSTANVPRGYRSWEEYYSRTGDYSIGPARTIPNSNYGSHSHGNCSCHGSR